MSELAPSSVQAFIEALNGGKGDLDAWLECNNEAEVRAHIRACLAAPPAAPAPGDMVMVPLKFVQDFNTLAHNYCLRAVPPDYYSGTEADAFQHAYSRCGSDLRRLREILAAAPAPAVPRPQTEQDVFEDWLVSKCPSGDVDEVQRKWEASSELADFLAESAAPAVPAVCDGGTCGLGGYCANCPRQAAAPAVPVSWDRLRVLMDGIPTREEFIGGQRQQYVAKEAVMSWLHEGQLRAKREAVQPAAPTVQVVLRQPNLFASAPAVREPQDERAAFEAWIRKDSGDLTTFGSGSNMHYRNSAVNNAWTGWQARANGIGGGGNG